MTAMTLHDLLADAARRHGARPALADRGRSLDYDQLLATVETVAAGLRAAGVGRHDRVAVYLDKRVETVLAIFGAFAAGAVAVPVNPVLKPHQVGHILDDSGARLLITSAARLVTLGEVLPDTAVARAVCVDGPGGDSDGAAEAPPVTVESWSALLAAGDAPGGGARRCLDSDMAAILYTSGSTGRPKGVVLSHRNLVVGGQSVARYLGNGPGDSLLAALPLSFDAGFSQVTTAFASGARVVLHNYLTPADVPRVCAREGITGLTCVPPLWMQLVEARWPDAARESLRYFANTGGRLPGEVLAGLRDLFPRARPFLMYGLTEAFRSTYLDPAEVDRRPGSIGKAIPNAEILVVKSDGSLAGPGESGELVHRGPLVALGYWRDPARTAERFRPAPGQPAGLPVPDLAVWSGDTVSLDADGFLYFVGRNDEMIKTSGYRVSPTEVEEVVFASGLVREAAAYGVPDRALGAAIALAVVPAAAAPADSAELVAAIQAQCRRDLPGYMVPATVHRHETLPRSPNGKIDRKALAAAHDVAPAASDAPTVAVAEARP